MEKRNHARRQKADNGIRTPLRGGLSDEVSLSPLLPPPNPMDLLDAEQQDTLEMLRSEVAGWLFKFG